MKKSQSELAWRLADYQQHNEEAPERILADPTACEGELMEPAEVDEYIKDSIGTLMLLLDHGSSRFDEVRAAFLADLEFLHQLGKIDSDEYNEIVSSQELNDDQNLS